MEHVQSITMVNLTFTSLGQVMKMKDTLMQMFKSVKSVESLELREVNMNDKNFLL
jgi:hypothetical protein